jgi:hypothetical protein
MGTTATARQSGRKKTYSKKSSKIAKKVLDISLKPRYTNEAVARTGENRELRQGTLKTI